MVEAAIGVVLVLSVAASFALAPAAPEHTATLDAHADDAVEILRADAPVGSGATRLAALTRSAAAERRERAAARSRLASALPGTVAFRVRTPYGSFGDPRPPGATVGVASATTQHGRVTVRVWYA